VQGSASSSPLPPLPPLHLQTCDVSGRCEFQDLTLRYDVDAYLARNALPKLRKFRRVPSRREVPTAWPPLL
jgi:hypothetical protein